MTRSGGKADPPEQSRDPVVFVQGRESGLFALTLPRGGRAYLGCAPSHAGSAIAAMLAIAALVAKLAVALRIPTSAYRKGSLNASGAALAGLFAVTTLVLCPTLVFAASLLVFFFAGSRATRYKAGAKAKLEEADHVSTAKDGSKIKDTSSGNRDAWQVACNGLLGSLACAVWIANFGSTLERRTSSSALGCPVALPPVGRHDQQSLSNALVFTAVG